MMSATDSDNSIDWLASDNEDDESEREADCGGKRSRTDAPPSHLSESGEVKEGDGGWSEASSRRSPSSHAPTRDRDAIGLCQTQQGDKSIGRSTRQALKRPHSATGEERKERLLTSNESEEDRVFSRKCLELQCYIHPLSSILNGLRSGRYRQRLSSFQESVAMDRIQRIMGVLQNPGMGEKYVNIILKMEEMLKSWFPNVKAQDQHTVTQTEEAAPTKKLKLSPVTTAALVSAAVSPVNGSAPPVGAKALRVTDLAPAGAYSASNLKWLHTSPICSATAAQAQAGPTHPLSPRDGDLMQDNAVSSSTDSHAKIDSIPRGPPLGKINSPCLERLLKSTESIIARKGTGGAMGSIWS